MHKVWNYKKAVILFMLIVMSFAFSSCEYKETGNSVEDQTEAEGKIEDVPMMEKSEDEVLLVQKDEVLEVASEVNTDQTVVIRRGKEFLNCGICASGDMLYTFESSPESNSFFVAEMPKEEQQILWSHIELPDNMAVRNITTDYQRKYHVLLMEMGTVVIGDEELYVPTYEVSYIWTITREGEVERKLDVSDIFVKEQRTPTCFITDLEGNYYFNKENEILRFNPDSGVTMRWSCEGYEIEALACGKSGKIYCIYEDYQGADILELLEEEGIADLCLLLPNYDCKYCCMATGLNEELLIFNREGGVFAYTEGDTVVNQRIYERDMPVVGEDIFVDKILDDGRLCLMTMDSETEEILYYYMPTVNRGENE